jgi:hypothetical protein
VESPHRGRWLTAILLLAIAGVEIGLALAQPTPRSALPSDTTSISQISGPQEVRMTDAGVCYVVDPSLIVSAGPAKDGIPSIDHPVYVSASTADLWLTDDDLVLALDYQGIARAYPLKILVWHNIVNDVVAGDPVLVSYCPLCGSASAYARVIDGQAVEFGTSGKLYNSNLVLYDRLTDSYWSQFDGLALVGELAGQRLASIPLNVVLWGDWKATHANSEVLSKETGFARDYDNNPYEAYDEDSFVFGPVDQKTLLLPVKTPVLGVEVDGSYAAYREQDLIARGVIQDRVGGTRILVSRDEFGIISVRDLDRDMVIDSTRSYWFAWVTFHPTTTLQLFSGR